MWSGFVLIALVAGAFQVKGEVDCEVNKLQCENHLPLQRSIPGSIEDFDKICPNYTAYYECYLEYTNECETEPGPDSARLPYLVEYLRDACNKESATHALFERHFPCVPSHAYDVDLACKDTVNNALSSYMDANDINEQEDAVLATHLECYRVTASLACDAAKIEEGCGVGGKDFLLDLIRRTKYLGNLCSKEDAEKLLELLEALELSRVMKDLTKELMEL